MARVDALLADYAALHRTRGNVACHAVGIPFVVFGLFSILQRVPVAHVGFAPWTGAELVILAATAVYLVLDARLAFALLAAFLVLDFAALRAGDWRIGATTLLLGGVLVALGHVRYEKRPPARGRHPLRVLVGPVFLVNELLHVRRLHAPREV